MEEDPTLLISPRKRDVARLSHQVLAIRDTLPPDQQPSFDAAFESAHTALQMTVERLRKDSSLPLETPDAIPVKWWIKRGGKHGKSDARALTGAELAARDLKRQEVEKRKRLSREKEIKNPNVDMPLSTTAPARIGDEEGRNKRRRAETARRTEARAAGWL